jgi:hypothetical protein
MSDDTTTTTRYSLTRCSCSICGGGRLAVDIEPTYLASSDYTDRQGYTDHGVRQQLQRTGGLPVGVIRAL